MGFDVYSWVAIPLFIFLARVADVSFGTLRFIFIAKGFKKSAPLLGFVEVLIWFLVVREGLRCQTKKNPNVTKTGLRAGRKKKPLIVKHGFWGPATSRDCAGQRPLLRLSSFSPGSGYFCRREKRGRETPPPFFANNRTG